MNIRILVLSAVGALLLTTGCPMIKAAPRAGPNASSSTDSCPPGHVWSDGKCHDKGKGHDPAKHEDKGKKNKKKKKDK